MTKFNSKLLKLLTITAAILIVQIFLATPSMAKFVRKDLGSWHPEKINDKGQIVGWKVINGHTHALLWDDGKETDLGTLGGDNSYAHDINENGQIVGSSSIAGNTEQHAFLWDNGKMTDLGTLGGNNSNANRINDKGQIVGSSTIAGNNEYHAFLWDNGIMTDLGGKYSEACGINNKCQIILNSSDGSFLWENGKMTHVGGTVTSINEKGQVVGSLYSLYDKSYGFIWYNGKITNYMEALNEYIYLTPESFQDYEGPMPENQISAITSDINNEGQVVGFLTPNDMVKNILGGIMWYNDGISRLALPEKSNNLEIRGINNKGQSVGSYFVSQVTDTFSGLRGNFEYAFICEYVPDFSIASPEIYFIPSKPNQINIYASEEYGKLLKIKIGANEFYENYEYDGGRISIGGQCFSYYFADPNVQSLALTLDFENGDDPVITIKRGCNFLDYSYLYYDSSNPSDITVNTTSSAIKAVKINNTPLTSADYTVSGNAVTIKKSYLSYFFNKFTDPNQKLVLTFDFEDGNDPDLTIYRTQITNFIDCPSPFFDSSNPQDIKVNLKGTTLSDIKINKATLKNGIDYSVKGQVITIRKNYLNYYFSKYSNPFTKLELVFNFSYGNNPLLTVTRLPITNFVDSDNPFFDLSNPQDLTVNVSGGTLKEVKINSTPLTCLDYTISGNTVTIRKSYLNYYFTKYIELGAKLNLTFDFEKGNDPVFTITRMGEMF